jgi:O-antigen/teichoic acid export membrane protein
MNQKYKYLAKHLEILTISNFASKILIFLLVPLYTSILSTTEYGIFDLVVTTVSLLFPLLTANVVDAVMLFSMDKDYSNEEVASIGIKYISISILIVGLGLLVFSQFNIFSNIRKIRVFIFLYYLSYVLNQYFIQYAKGIEKVKEMGIAGVIGTIVMIGANILFLVVIKAGLSGFFIANIFAQAIPASYLFFRLQFWKILRSLSKNRQLEKQMIFYSLPLVCTSLGWWVNNAADKYVVTWLCGVTANGILSVSYKIPSIINTLQGIFNQAWQISAVKEYGEMDMASFYGKTFTYLNVMMCIACSGLILLTKPLAHFLYAKDFYAAWQYAPYLLISSTLNFASGFIGPILAAKKDSKSMAMAAVYGAIVNIILNIALVYLMGIQGATTATVVSSLVIYCVRKHSVKNELKVESYWKVLLTWGLLMLQSVAEIYTSAWYTEIGIIIILITVNRSALREILRIFFKKVG